MIDTTTIRFTPACTPASCRLRAAAVKNWVAASCSGEGRRQTLPSDQVHPARTRHRNNVISAGLEHIDDMAANSSGRSCYRNLPTYVHDDTPSVRPIFQACAFAVGLMVWLKRLSGS